MIQPASSRFRRHSISFALITIGLIVYAATMWNVLPSQKKSARRQISSAYALIGIGASANQTEEILREFAQAGHRFSLKVMPDGLVLSAPPELPGFTTNWQLLVWSHNEEIVGKAIRVTEGWFRPCEAPLDEGDVIKSDPLPDGSYCF